MENYSAIKRNEAMICATTQMKLKNTMLSEVSLSLEALQYDFIFMNCPEEANP